jgi:hypothetical protein
VDIKKNLRLEDNKINVLAWGRLWNPCQVEEVHYEALAPLLKGGPGRIASLTAPPALHFSLQCLYIAFSKPSWHPTLGQLYSTYECRGG